MSTVREREYGYLGAPEQARIITIEDRARQAFAANLTYLNLASPTTAQNTAQVKRLTREVNGLLRFLLADFSTDADT